MGIRFQNVGFSYETIASETLRDVNLEINKENEFITILGHTGSGKSTLVQLMNALNLPLEGVVEVAGIKIYPKNKEKLKPIRKHVGLVFQFPEYQLFEETVLKDVMFGPKNFLGKDKDVLEEAKSALKMVNLDPALYERSPFNLSGGQMRRVAIAGIIAMQPKCIVLDEPTAMLDPRGRKEVMDTVLALNREKKITVILITHHMDEAARAQRVVVMDKGVVVADGAPETVFSQVELLHSIRLAAPDTVELCNELNKNGFDLPLDKLEAETCAQALYDAIKA